ncbi:MAG: 16S rRNA (guanine(527)-N(7))-methyltransferase RsmG [Clostridia bacterium]|nr:16S rRNA (guanine(527)-N(7))-methyltransferase RsmG [Oscillospiraceae bacterium]MBR3273359.1 16S rRNA (guanine(527)-N(7))-methyltransferase RsmG [Clostridia bacterium]
MLKTFLLDRAAAMGIPMTAGQAEQFNLYHEMLVEANARMNLTRVPDDPAEAVDRNYLDCVAPLAGGFPDAATAVDVGSGAGFPGIPLAIMLPDTRFTLIDALGKRVDFLREVIDRLGLNAVALHLRAEDAARREDLREGFDLAVARAVAPMNVLCEYLLPLVKVGGHMLALKGPGLDDELTQAGNALSLLGGAIERTQPLAIPGRDWNHQAAWIKKAAPTPEKYPRRAGAAEKRPL